MSALVTAAEAQALLDALSAPRGRHSLNCHTHRDCDGCRDDDRRDSLRHHNAAPLARTVVAQADANDRLLAVIGDAAASLDGEHMVTCARWVSVRALCDCIVGRVRATLAKAATP